MGRLQAEQWMASSHADNAALGLLVSSVTEKFGTLANHPDGGLNVLREVRLLLSAQKDYRRRAHPRDHLRRSTDSSAVRSATIESRWTWRSFEHVAAKSVSIQMPYQLTKLDVGSLQRYKFHGIEPIAFPPELQRQSEVERMNEFGPVFSLRFGREHWQRRQTWDAA